MRVLDRYLLKELLIPILFCLITLIFLVLIADLFNNIDTLLKNHTPLTLIFRYYLMLVPFAFTQTIPWATLLGATFLFVNFNVHNEIVAMKVAGLEVTSIIRPLVFLGFLIGIFTFLVSDHVVPQTFRIANDLREVHIEKKRSKAEGKIFQNVTYYSGGNQLQYYRYFNYGKNQVEDAILLWIDPTNRNTQRKMVAKKGKWDGSRWIFENVMEYELGAQGQLIGEPRNFATKSYEDMKSTPEDLRRASTESYFLSSRELKRYIQKLQENGIKAYSEKVEQQYRLAAPWQSLIMIMIVTPLLCPTQSKKVIAFHVLICIGIVIAFHLTGAVALALGKTGRLPPFLSAWLNTFLFCGGGLFFLERGNE